MKNKPNTLQREFSWSFAKKWTSVPYRIMGNVHEIQMWCDANCQGRWACGYNTMWFANPLDRTAFVLNFLQAA